MTCLTPFSELRCAPTVHTTCCACWLDTNAWHGVWGQYTDEIDQDPWQIWNNVVFQKLRTAILQSDFKFCKNCDKILAGHLEGRIEPWMKPIMELPPKRIWLEHDRHCNLRCPTCRPEFITRSDTQTKRDTKVMALCEEFLPTATHIVLMAAGEPLISHSSLQIIAGLHKYPNLGIELFTNGLLIPEKWHLFSEKQISKIFMSVDAATQATYSKVRYPGNWLKLQEALQFIKAKRSAGLIPEWQVNFVVQAANYREIPDFIQMCLDLGVTICFLTSVIKTYHTDGEFLTINICDPRHPEHKDFLNVLKHPLMRLCGSGTVPREDMLVLCPTLWKFMPDREWT